jgi:hypothetical protein
LVHLFEPIRSVIDTLSQPAGLIARPSSSCANEFKSL